MKIFLTLLFTTSINIYAQINFQNHIVIDDSYSTDGVNTAYSIDIDGDGDMDILTSSAMDDKIAWYKNIDGQGVFDKQQIITTDADYVRSVYASDIDGDGDMDVIAAIAGENMIAWYKNIDGLGNFSSQQIITIDAQSAQDVFSSDIDGDGDMDVLSASFGDDKIAWYENIDGEGNFGTQQIISTNADAANTVFSIDIDSDGDMDVLSASGNDHKVAWYENTDSLGSFGSEQIISSTGVPVSIFAIDIDGDSDIDVLSTSWTTNKVMWYENLNGLGNFDTEQIITTDADYVRSVYAGDIDNDGDIDVLSASDGDHRIAWYENTDGLGDFGTQQIIAINNYHADTVYASDLDGDGDLDVINTQNWVGEVHWNENLDGLGSYSENKMITTYVNGVRDVFIIDIDNDGYKDLLSASQTDDKIAWYKNTDGEGNFGVQRVITINADSTDSVYASDIDGDGDMDVLSASNGDEKIAWYENIDGLGNFGMQQVISSNEWGAKDVFSCDVDNDGDMDVLSASTYHIAWFENLDGNGTFSANQNISSIQDASSVYASDIDADGDLDILSSSSWDNEICWHENIDGLGSFSEKQIITSNANNAKEVFSIDIDGDGDMDVLSASFYDDKIAWYENIDGLGTFSVEKIITVDADGAYSVFACDIDNDGDIDVLSASYLDDKIAWYENIDGQGLFGTELIITLDEGEANHVFATDIDNDGDIDVFPAHKQDSGNFHTISWYENLSSLNISDKIITNDFIIYPVPTTDILNIKSGFNITKIEIFNKLGQIVNKNRAKSKINISDLTSGIYFVKVENMNGDIGMKKVLKK